jgi:dipeptidyl aminopeptidase/acylaminoacyl peptidase
MRTFRFAIMLIVAGMISVSASIAAGREEAVYVKSFDGVYVAGYLRIPDGPGPHPAIMVVHGGSGGMGMELIEKSAGRYVQSHFLADGYIVFQVDYRHYNLGQGELEDVIACYRYLAQRTEVDPKRIGVLGGSHGGTIALMLATRLTPAAVVAFSAMPDWSGRMYEMVQQLLPTLRDDPDWQERRLHHGRTIPEELAMIESGEYDPDKPVRPNMMQEVGLDLAFQWGADPAPFQHYSPIDRTADMHCPVLYVVGSEDRNLAGGKEIIENLQALGRTAEYSEHSGMPHAFYWGIRPDEDGSLPTEFYRSLKKTTDFLRQYVKNADQE